MNVTIVKTTLAEILPLREIFLEENKFQIRYHAVHQRGWSDSYLISLQGESIGYGSVMGGNDRRDRDTLFEFFLLAPFRAQNDLIFLELLKTSKVALIECQSNELLLTSMLRQFCENIKEPVILFEDEKETQIVKRDVLFRARKPDDRVFDHKSEPVGEYVLDLQGEVIATGGYLLHYNPPFSDFYMEVKTEHRRKGYGSFLLQEIKKVCYRSGYLPAARCDISNEASRATLVRAGFKIAGHMLSGEVKHEFIS